MNILFTLILPPESINILGLSLNFIGSIFLSIEALKPRAFISKIENNSDYKKKLVNNSFVATINQTFVFILITLITFLFFIFFSPKTNIYFDICISPLGYFLRKFLIFLAEKFHKIIVKVGSLIKYKPSGFISSLIYIVLLIPWLLLMLISWFIVFIIDFGIDIPLRSFSEYVIGNFIKKIYFCLNKTLKRNEDFNKIAFQGALLFIIGFLFQLIYVVCSLYSQ